MKRSRDRGSITESEFAEAQAKHLVVTFFSKSKDGDARYLSNFESSQPLIIDGKEYASIEHRFQAAKYECSKKLGSAEAPDFTTAGKMSAAQAKSKGGRKGMGSGWALDVSLWNARRLEIMTEAIRARLAQDEKFRDIAVRMRKEGKLLLHFERGKNPYWGARVTESKQLEGQNMLGEILMREIAQMPPV